MRLSLTFEDCTPQDAARLIQAAGPLGGAVTALPPASAAGAPLMGAGPVAAQPPAQPPTSSPPPAQPPAQAAAPAPQPGQLTPEHLYDPMSKYAQTYKPEGIKAVMAQCGLASGLLPQADQTQLYWIKKFFESMKPPGTPFDQL